MMTPFDPLNIVEEDGAEEGGDRVGGGIFWTEFEFI
jgi:hypothetical protein